MKHLYHFIPIFILFAIPLYSTESFSSDSLRFRAPKIVVTASRYEQNAFETHVPVRVIPEQRIWQTGADNLSALLESEAGLNPVSSGPWSQKFVIRGLEGHNLTLIDGQRLDVLRDYGQHAPLIDVDQIARIEVIRGPASVLYGSDAVAGVVNIITKQPSLPQFAWEVKSGVGLQYASVNRQFSQTASLDGNWRRWRFLLSLNNREAEDVHTPKGVLRNTGFAGYAIDSKLVYGLSDRQELILNGHLSRMRDVGVPINPFAIDARFLNYDRNRAAATYTFRNGQGIFSGVEVQTYYEQGERHFRASLYHVPNGALFVNNLLDANRRVKTFGGHVQTRLSPMFQNLLTLGAESFAEFDDTDRIADPVVVDAQDQVKKDPPADLTPPTPKSNRVGLGMYIEDEFRPFSRLTISAGGRFDVIQSHAEGTTGTLVPTTLDKTDQDVSGNLGLIYALSKSLRLTANVGRAFKAPTLQQRFFKGTAQVGFLTGDPNLESETSLNFDLGLKWQTGRIRGEVSVFQNRIENFIVMNPVNVTTGEYKYANVGEAALYGGEIQSDFRVLSWITLHGQMAYVHGEDVNLGEPLPQISPLDGSVSVRFESGHSGDWIEVAGQFVASQNRVAPKELETAGYNLLHVSSGVNLDTVLPFRFPFFLTVNVRNVLNNSYREHLSTVTWWDAPGRNVVVGIKGNF